MTIHTIPTTIGMSDNSFSLTGLAAGDQIVTLGYYNTNDGGAATFAVKSGSTADGVFTHTLYGYSGLIAQLVIQDGVVNVDQLGADTFGVSYTPFSLPAEFLDINGCTNEQRNLKRNELFACAEQLMSSAGYDSNDPHVEKTKANRNTAVIAAAISNANVHELRFTGGKLYGVHGFASGAGIDAAIHIEGRSDFTLNGCGATIQALHAPTGHAICVNVSPNPASFRASGITIRDLTVRALCYNNNTPMINHGIYAANVDNFTLENVRVENAQYGVRVSGSNTNVRMENLHICNVFTGMQLTDIDGGHLLDTHISCEWNNLLEAGTAKYNHCIYATGTIRDFCFEHLELLYAGEGNAVNRNGGSTPSENLVFADIRVDRCKRAFNLEGKTHNTVVHNVSATMLRYAGFQLGGVQNIRVSDSCFFGDDAVCAGETKKEEKTCCGFLIGDDSRLENNTWITEQNAYVKNVTIQHCCFDFSQKFFRIGQNRFANCTNIQVINCKFKVNHPTLKYKLTPAYIKGIIDDIRFYKCCFETSGFTNENHSKNGVFFFFVSVLSSPSQYTGTIATLNKMHWVFEKCTFVNNGSVSVNSPFLSRADNDNNNTVFCFIQKSAMKGFRWLFRVASTQDTIDYVGDVNNQEQVIYQLINPCLSGSGTTLQSDAIDLLNNKKRLAARNIFYIEEIPSGTKQMRMALGFGI